MTVSPEFEAAVRKEVARQRRIRRIERKLLARRGIEAPVFGAGGQQGKELRSLGQQVAQLKGQLERFEQIVTGLKNKATKVTRTLVKNDKKLGMELVKAAVLLEDALQGVGEANDALYKADNIIGSVSVKYHG